VSNNQAYEECGVHWNNELTNDKIVLFLSDNELAEKEMDWLKAHRTMSEVEAIKLFGQVILNRNSS
jgi:hypothetical protein